MPVSPNGFAIATAGVVSVPSPLDSTTSTIALGTQGVPGALVGGRVKPLPVKTYCPFRLLIWHLPAAAANPGRHRTSGRTITNALFIGGSFFFVLTALLLKTVQRGRAELPCC